MAIGKGDIMKPIAAVIMTLALAACSTTPSTPPPSGAAAPAPSFGQKVANLLSSGTTNPTPEEVAEEKMRVFCPEFAIQPGTAAYQLYEPRHENDPFSLRYQARFGKLARECDVTGTTVTLKIGFAGRALVGPKGSGGTTLTLPVRLVLLDNDDKPVFSRLEQVAVAIPPGSGGADFSRIVTSDPIPIPPARLAGWKLRIGFDTGPAARPAHGARHPRARRHG
jgi:hypothetical protein